MSLKKKNMLVAQLCLILCHLMEHSLPGSSVHGILQARILEWIAIPFSRGSSYPGIKLGCPALQVDSLPSESLGTPHYVTYIQLILKTTEDVNSIIII